ncbi:uncharacterized protein LY79DRAFT_671056 [Colletotrichum navitas]|uniref:Nucleoside phosphorylase domain-containing protein n=1 Tax=Colletotrichum navitas TaxID=681940 RepID=A0AAD8PVM0_9PEZI|nr:uncharacterized protein LY79DRAFT_671056 [Colletotrichum navitas]KAK1585461.1 hypothetical protein LY79DRAFT_671056 [Colletotrichum navitas]
MRPKEFATLRFSSVLSMRPDHALSVKDPPISRHRSPNAAASLRSSFTGLGLAIVTGICGGVPNPGTGDEIILGDVIISRTVVQFDYGRQYPDRFIRRDIRRDTLDDNLGRPNRYIRSLLSTFDTDRGRDGLQRGAAQAINRMQGARGTCHVIIQIKALVASVLMRQVFKD